MAHQDDFRGFSNPTVPNIWPAPDQMNIGHDEYADIPGALSALAADQQLLVGEGTFTASIPRLMVSANVAGSGIGVSTWQNIGAESFAFQALGVTSVIQDMTFHNNGTSQGAGFSVTTAGASIELRHVEGIGLSTGGTGNGFSFTAGTILMVDCEGSSTGAGSNRGLSVAGATVTVVGGRFTNEVRVTSGTAEIYNSVIDADLTISGGTVTLKGPTITGTVTISSGVVSQDSYYFDTLGRLFSPSTPLWPNPIINGAFQVWQRGTSFTSVANNTFTADRFIYGKVGTMVHDISRSTDVPTVSQAGLLVPYSFLLDCTTADAAIAAGDLTIIRHYIEGSNWADMAQRQFTISFWVKATKTGTYCIGFGNSGGDRSYVAEYTVDTTDTWELKRITVSASPSAGTWDYTTGIGLTVTWAIDAGSTFQTTAGSWQTGNFFATSNQVNGSDNTANNFRLALIDISPGPFAPAVRLPDIQQEEARCFRYCWVPSAATNTANMMTGAKFSTTVVVVNRYPPVPMRATPVLTHNVTAYTNGNPGTTQVALLDFGAGGYATITGALTFAGAGMSPDTLGVSLTAGTSWSGTAGNVFQLRIGPDVKMVFAPSDYS